VAGWRYVVNFFKSEGASNVTFVWNPWHPEGVRRYFPGAPYFDWFGLPCSTMAALIRTENGILSKSFTNPSTANSPDWVSISPRCWPNSGSTAYGGNPRQMAGRGDGLNRDAPSEIRGAVFFHSDCDPNWPTPWRPPGNPCCIDWMFLRDSGAVAMLHPILFPPPFGRATGATTAELGTE
jgi:cellulose synthase (UDP-forming)